MKVNPSRISTSRSWRKAVVLARAAISRGRHPRLLAELLQDRSVTPRLCDQALACLCAYRNLDYEREKKLARRELESVPGVGFAYGAALASSH